MGKKPKNKNSFDPELLKMYMTGAANPGNSNKINYADDVVDLHLDQQQVGKNKIPPQDALFHQLDEFEKAMDKAIASGKLEFRVVHGLGKGKLKEAIHKLLDKHPQVKSYENSYHSKYGFGSTVVYFY
ncbi:MAG: Smr/MutS family protein [Chitinophagales bacterium]|nr:Smr/MutS family protein [Chitinophagales bacterium]